VIKKLFAVKYNDTLVLEMLNSAKSGIIASNFIAVLIIITVLYDYVPTYHLIIWFGIQTILAGVRLYIGSRLLFAIKNNISNNYLSLYILTIAISALMFGSVVFSSLFHTIPETSILIIGIIIVALTAGSIATLGTVLLAYIVFLILSILPLSFVLLYHGGLVYNIYALILLIYLLMHLSSGKRLFLRHQKSIELEEKYKTIYNQSSDGIAIIKNNRFTECNNALTNMFGYEQAEFFTIHISKLSPKMQLNGKSSTKQMLQKLYQAKKRIVTFEWKHLRKSGEEFWVEITLHTIKLNEEDMIYGIWRDINDRKKAEFEVINLNNILSSRVKEEVEKNREKDKQMMQQSRLAQMGEMISMIAHQWRQPLAAISATSSSLELKAYLGEVDREIITKSSKNISKYSQHLSSTINDFREFFKPNKERKETTYARLVEEALSIIEMSIKNKNIDVLIKINTDDKLFTYENEIKQVILNILKNAEDVLLEREIINPKITIESDGLSLYISDNGGGVPSEIIDDIFNPYFSTKTQKDGTGLGLYMSKMIIKEHCSGDLSVSNNNDGAVFKINLGTNI